MKWKTIIERHTLCPEQAVLFKHLPHPAISSRFFFFFAHLLSTMRAIHAKIEKKSYVQIYNYSLQK